MGLPRKTTPRWISALLLANVCITAFATDGGKGGGGKHDSHAQHDHAHGHHHHAHSHGANAGKPLAYQLAAQSNYDAANRERINKTAEAALKNSAQIDKMLESGKIGQQGWQMLKDTMTQSMMQQFEGKPPATIINVNEASTPAPLTVGDFDTNLEDGAVQTGGIEEEPAHLIQAAGIAEDAPSNETRGMTEVVDLQSAVPYMLAADARSATDSAIGATPTPELGDVPPAELTYGNTLEALRTDGSERMDSTDSINTKAVAVSTEPLSFDKPAVQRSLASTSNRSIPRQIMSGIRTTLGLPADKSIPRALVALAAGLDKPDLKLSHSLRDPEQEEAPASEGLALLEDFLFFLTLALAGSGVGYYAYSRRTRSAPVNIMVPGNGEHFALRTGNKLGEFVLDIKDTRGRMVRSAGMLRPESVARAAVLPPTLAAELGAKNAFDRFEFTSQGHFVRTEKEEGYQVFPFAAG